MARGEKKARILASKIRNDNPDIALALLNDVHDLRVNGQHVHTFSNFLTEHPWI